MFSVADCLRRVLTTAPVRTGASDDDDDDPIRPSVVTDGGGPATIALHGSLSGCSCTSRSCAMARRSNGIRASIVGQ